MGKAWTAIIIVLALAVTALAYVGIVMPAMTPKTSLTTTLTVTTTSFYTNTVVIGPAQKVTTTQWTVTTSFAISYYTKTVVIGPAQTVTTTVGAAFPAEVFFSPRGECKQQVIRWINAANSSIHVLIYSFTLDDVGAALISARQRGVEVRVLLEESQISQYSEYAQLKAAGVSVKNDTNSALMHHKLAIVDGYVTLCGSFNWSTSAEERNNENLLVIRDPVLGQQFETEFEKIWNEGIGQ